MTEEILGLRQFVYCEEYTLKTLAELGITSFPDILKTAGKDRDIGEAIDEELVKRLQSVELKITQEQKEFLGKDFSDILDYNKILFSNITPEKADIFYCDKCLTTAENEPWPDFNTAFQKLYMGLNLYKRDSPENKSFNELTELLKNEDWILEAGSGVFLEKTGDYIRETIVRNREFKKAKNSLKPKLEEFVRIHKKENVHLFNRIFFGDIKFIDLMVFKDNLITAFQTYKNILGKENILKTTYKPQIQGLINLYSQNGFTQTEKSYVERLQKFLDRPLNKI